MYNLPSQMACNVVRPVIGSYKTNLKNGMAWTFCKYNVPQMTLSWNRDYSLNQNKFSVGTIKGRIKCDYDITGMERYFDMMNARRTLSSSDESKPYPYRPSFRFFPKRGVVGRGMAEEIAFNGSGNKNSSFSQILLYFFNGLHIIRHQNIQLFHLFPFWRCR